MRHPGFLVLFLIVTASLVSISSDAKESHFIKRSAFGSLTLYAKEPIRCLGDDPQNRADALAIVSEYAFADPSEIAVLEASCTKMVMSAEHKKVIVEVSADDARVLRLSMHHMNKPADQRSCINDVQRLIDRHGIKEARAVLADYKRQFPKRFNDPEKGPLRWVDCSDKNLIDYIPRLTHELVHALRRETRYSVIYYRVNKKPLSMSFRHVGYGVSEDDFFKKFKVRDSTEKEIIEGMLKMYSPNDTVALVDEVNAYTVDEKIGLELLKRRLGKDYNRIENRTGFTTAFKLPIMMVLLQVHIEGVKKYAPKQMNEFFLDTQRKEVINTIWKDALRQSNIIYTYLRDNNIPMHDFERKYFEYIFRSPPELVR